MPIAPGLIQTAEIVTIATAAAGGSNAPASYNVYHYKRGSTVPVLDKTVLKNIFVTTIITPLLAAMNIRYTLSSITVRWVDDALDGPQTFANPGVGAIGSDSYDTQSAVALLLRTGIRGKKYRGSKHFSPLSEVDTTADILTGAGLARWQTVQTALAANMNDANGNVWSPCVLSRSLSQLVTNPTVVVANNVTQCLLNLNIGTMRHRRVRTVR